jgi:hypothetical protein
MVDRSLEQAAHRRATQLRIFMDWPPQRDIHVPHPYHLYQAPVAPCKEAFPPEKNFAHHEHFCRFFAHVQMKGKKAA